MAWAGATYLSHPVLAFRIFRLGKKWMTVGGGVMYFPTQGLIMCLVKGKVDLPFCPL
uniref:Uncharacterized protein n=1 Tax=Vitis vinifera TaxID=29760 RepID=F6GXD9_VITVI